jgi:hypothetical protein
MTLPVHWRKQALLRCDSSQLIGAIRNQTNLALKGMIGIQAMAVIANRTGHTEDATNYNNIAHDYIAQWQNLAIAKDANPPRTTLSYGDSTSHGMPNLPARTSALSNNSVGLLYNLFADAQLGLGLVPQYVYQMQSEFYPTVANQYGVPLDTRHTYTKGKDCI